MVVVLALMARAGTSITSVCMQTVGRVVGICFDRTSAATIETLGRAEACRVEHIILI